jgi:hypothetical protein
MTLIRMPCANGFGIPWAAVTSRSFEITYNREVYFPAAAVSRRICKAFQVNICSLFVALIRSRCTQCVYRAFFGSVRLSDGGRFAGNLFNLRMSSAPSSTPPKIPSPPRVISPPTSPCNRSRSTPMAPFRSRAGNFCARARLSPTTARKTSPNMEAPHPTASRRNKSRPNAPRLSRPRAPAPCHIDTRRPPPTRAPTPPSQLPSINLFHGRSLLALLPGIALKQYTRPNDFFLCRSVCDYSERIR